VGAGGDQAEGLDHLAEVRHLDYRDVEETRLRRGQLDRADRAHRRAQLPVVLRVPRGQAAPGGRLLNHCITRPDNKQAGLPARLHRPLRLPRRRAHRLGRIVTEMQDAGLEVQHEENLREHYAKTLHGWCRNLVDTGTSASPRSGEGTARVWGLYMAGSRLGFERNEIQLHQVLATKTDDGGTAATRCATPSDAPCEPACEVQGLWSTGRLTLAGEHPGPAVRRDVLRREQLSRTTSCGSCSAVDGLADFASTGVPDEWVGADGARAVPDPLLHGALLVGGELVLDVVVHEVGLVTEWAAATASATTVTITEPKGSFAMPADAAWLLLVGDLTALPAMARIAETVTVPVRAWAEVPDDAAPATCPRREVTWLDAARRRESRDWPRSSRGSTGRRARATSGWRGSPRRCARSAST
jgi:hypothetical protein